MEISPDILNINGILVSAKAKYGDLSKISHYGLSGESTVTYIRESLVMFLNDKHYLEDNIPKRHYESYFRELSVFLLVNCNFSKPFKVPKYEHLTCNIPKLSIYLVMKLAVDLNLFEYFTYALLELPLEYTCEVFPELLPIMDKKKSPNFLKNTQLIVCCIIMIANHNKELKYTDEMDKLLRHAPEFIYLMTRIAIEDTKLMRKNKFYETTGWTLYNLLDLLFICHKTDTLEGIIIDKLIEATISVVRAVSLDMFIYWAEMDLPESERSMQAHIAETAYDAIEKFRHHNAAADLISSLTPFAQKPKDIKEQISRADLDKIIVMVDKADENQNKWFQALIFSSFFSNKKAMECVSKWGHLCDENDISRLLNQSAQIEDEEPKKLALKCASQLVLEKLIVVVIRHFYKNGFVVFKNNRPEMIVWFNKLKDSELVSRDTSLELLLFILENPDSSVNFMITECIKSEFYVSSLYNCFIKLLDILKIHDICLNNLKKVIRNIPPSAETYQSYKKLTQTFIDINLMSFEVFSDKIVCPLLVQYLEDDNYEEMKQLLILLNNLELRITVEERTKIFFENLFKILDRRTPFLNHNPAVQSVIQEVVHLIGNKISLNQQIDYPLFSVNLEEQKLTTYYKEHICNPGDNRTLLQYLIEDFSAENNTRAICQLMKILPCCVQDEWISICSEVSQKAGLVKLVQILKDMIILLCDFTRSQENKDVYDTLLEALRYCVHQYGFILKTRVLSLNDEENEIVITQSLVSMMAHFPDRLKETEGLNIIQSLMTDKSLRRLGNDQNFVTSICKIKNTSLCQIIATKILK